MWKLSQGFRVELIVLGHVGSEDSLKALEFWVQGRGRLLG